MDSYKGNYEENYKTFFRNYEYLQKILKTIYSNNEEFYYLGIKDIIAQNDRLGVDCTSPLNNWNQILQIQTTKFVEKWREENSQLIRSLPS
jgi:hypothetical protein